LPRTEEIILQDAPWRGPTWVGGDCPPLAPGEETVLQEHLGKDLPGPDVQGMEEKLLGPEEELLGA
jgi:hypothetical protein